MPPRPFLVISKESEIRAFKDKIGHKSGGFEIFTPFCYKSRLVLGFFSWQNTNFHEGVHSISNIGPYYIKYKYPNTVFIVFIDNKLSNLNNVAHGGFLMAYADSVGGFYAYNKVKKPIVTVNLNCNFIKPVSVGSWLEAKAEIKTGGKSLIFVEIEMFIKKKLVFSSSGIWKIINIAKH